MKIVYCGYDFFHTCLGGLIDAGHDIVALFTWPCDNKYDFNTKVIALAEAHGAPVTLAPMTAEDVTQFRDKKVDAVIAAAYPYKIPDLSGIAYGMNIHPSPLPIGRGPWPMPHVILNQLSETAVVIHELSGKWDAGDIIAEMKLPVSERETIESISLRTQMAAKPLLLDVMRDPAKAFAGKRPQGPDGSYWRMSTRQDKLIEWTMSVREIDRIVRAFSKFEPSVWIDGVRYFVRKIDWWEEPHDYAPGTLVHQGSREPVFAAADGFVALSHYIKADE